MVSLGMEAKSVCGTAALMERAADGVPSSEPGWTMPLPGGRMASERRGGKLPMAKLENGFIRSDTYPAD